MINQNIFPSDDHYEEILTKNQRGIRNLQTKYFQNQYEKSIANKQSEQRQHLLEKEKELQIYKSLNSNYLNDIRIDRLKTLRDKSYLSREYDDEIQMLQEKQKHDKAIEKNIQKHTLVSPTWQRNYNQERDTYLKNMHHYGKQLDDHVKIQQQIKRQEIQQQSLLKQKISCEAEQILQKEYRYLEDRHRQKSLFEQRQNQILGIKPGQQKELLKSDLFDKETLLKKKERQLYSQGLEVQFQREMDKRKAVSSTIQPTNHVYNPITNPIPFAYKNPNVLRMLQG